MARWDCERFVESHGSPSRSRRRDQDAGHLWEPGLPERARCLPMLRHTNPGRLPFLAWILPFKVERVCWSFPSIGAGTTRGTLGEICFSSVTGALKVGQCLWNFVARREGIGPVFPLQRSELSFSGHPLCHSIPIEYRLGISGEFCE